MITTILSDFSYVILFPKDKIYHGSLNKLNQILSPRSNYRFLDYFEFNEELLSFYTSLKNNYSLNIFTTDNIQEKPEVQNKISTIFKNTFNAKELKLDKTVPKAYITIAENLKKQVSEIIYVDDQKINIEAASKAGLYTIHFSNNQKLYTDLKQYYKIEAINYL